MICAHLRVAQGLCQLNVSNPVRCLKTGIDRSGINFITACWMYDTELYLMDTLTCLDTCHQLCKLLATRLSSFSRAA